MNILVTGSTGFIGSHLCRVLVERGDSVRAFHRSSSSLKLLEGFSVEHCIGDLTKPETISTAVKDMDVIFHCAALLGGREEPGKMYTVTVEGTRMLLRAAIEAGVSRFIHTSTSATLGVPEYSPVDSQPFVALMNENHTWNFKPEFWPYGYTKYLAEQEVQAAVARGLDAVIVNPTNVFGAGDIYRQRSSLVVQIARRQLPFSIEGGLNVVHIDDVIAGHIAALERGGSGERYILGGENLPIPQLFNRIAAVVDVDPPRLTMPTGLVKRLAGPLEWVQSFIHLPQRASLLRLAGHYLYFDQRKAQTELVLSPPLPIEKAFQEAYEWYAGIGVIGGKT